VINGAYSPLKFSLQENNIKLISIFRRVFLQMPFMPAILHFFQLFQL